MLFPTLIFLYFFILLIIVLLCLNDNIIFPSANKNIDKKKVLLVASYIFYMWWYPPLILLIIFSTAVDFYIGSKIENASLRRKKILLLWSICTNLGLLAFFKYANFFQDNLFLFLRMFGYEPHWSTIEIILPVGISFYTFQTMSYTIDIYRGNLKPCTSRLDFALFVSFFPQLVAGPIVRAKDFLPQLQKNIKLNFKARHLFLIVRGLVKKVIIADNIAIFCDIVFRDPTLWNSSIIWLATICFSVQIYCDFSGYTDMAIGIAAILGFHLPENFKRPYFATNPSDFWKRWHISLSSWLRDYLYISMGGSRLGKWRTYQNLFATMVIGGLWHGASWNFVFWGFLHGFALTVYHISKEIFSLPNKLIFKILSFFLMQYWILLTWISFRVKDFNEMFYCLQKFIFFDFDLQFRNIGLGNLGIFSTLFFLLLFSILHIYSHIFGDIDKKLSESSSSVTILASIIIGFVLFILWPTKESPFIYFQF